MKPGGGKQKGANFERTICRELSLWISHNTHDDLFWRSSLSGGRATAKFKKGGENRTQQGDITAIHPTGNPLTNRFLISCKFYRDLQLEGSMLGNKSRLNLFWEECVAEAFRYKKLPMMIAKQNNTAPIVCLNRYGAVTLNVVSQYIAMLPAGGGMQIMWLKTFLLRAKAPC